MGTLLELSVGIARAVSFVVKLITMFNWLRSTEKTFNIYCKLYCKIPETRILMAYTATAGGETRTLSADNDLGVSVLAEANKMKKS